MAAVEPGDVLHAEVRPAPAAREREPVLVQHAAVELVVGVPEVQVDVAEALGVAAQRQVAAEAAVERPGQRLEAGRVEAQAEARVRIRALEVGVERGGELRAVAHVADPVVRGDGDLGVGRELGAVAAVADVGDRLVPAALFGCAVVLRRGEVAAQRVPAPAQPVDTVGRAVGLLRGRDQVRDVAVADRDREADAAREAADLELAVAGAGDLAVGQAVLRRPVADDQRAGRQRPRAVAERARDGDRALLGAALGDHRERGRVVVGRDRRPVPAGAVEPELVRSVAFEHDRALAEPAPAARRRRDRRHGQRPRHGDRGRRRRRARRGGRRIDGEARRGERQVKPDRQERSRAERRVGREAQGRSGQARGARDRDDAAQTKTHTRTIGALRTPL